MHKVKAEFPAVADLGRDIKEIEAQSFDEKIRKTIQERIAISNDPETVFVNHEDVFKSSQKRLLAKLMK